MPFSSGEPFGPAFPRSPVPLPLRPAPGRRETVLVLGLGFLLYLFLGFAFLLAGQRMSLLLIQPLAFALPPILAVRLFYLDRRRVLPFGAPAPRHLLAGVIGIAGLNHLLTLYGVWQERVWPPPDTWRATFDALLHTEGAIDFAGLVVAVAIAPAVCEEILFRGFVQSGLVRQAERPWRGVLTTAVLFGLFHLDPWRFVMVVALGVFLGWLRQVSGSLWPAILAHAVNNLITLGLTAAGFPPAGRAPGTVLTAIGAAGLVTLAFAIGRRPSETAAERVL